MLEGNYCSKHWNILRSKALFDYASSITFYYFNITDMHITVALYNYIIGLQELKRAKNGEENSEIMSSNLAGTLTALSQSNSF